MCDKSEDKRKRMKELTALLNEAGKTYYQQSRELMSNLEYDRLYDALLQLEKETGIILSNSPTIHVGYEVLSDLPKEAHAQRMLSLDKTKDAEALAEWLGDQKGLLSWKLDGLTIILSYNGGTLTKAVTRGNGEIGEVITNNARVFENLPVNIEYQGELLLRGEAVIKYSDFEKINAQIPEADARYKNPRNLCSGTVRQLNNEITAQRHVHFYAFALVKAEGGDEPIFANSRQRQMEWLARQGFEVVEYKAVSRGTVIDAVAEFAETISQGGEDLPSDGLVLIYDDLEYGKSLGNTAKFPRDSIAFKWQDTLQDTTLSEIEWSASRTGLINPIAIFEPVELEGTTVSRASVHNVSILKELELGLGDTIQVYKANMIIPQIAENKTRSGTVAIPGKCPVCGGKAELQKENDVEVLYCTNDKCLAKQIKAFTLFVSRDAMNIEGLSEATIEKLIAKGLIREPADLFHVEKYKEEITEMEGFGEKSYQNLVASIKRAKEAATPARLLYSLGIPGIGVANAKLICRAYKNDWDKIQALTREELSDISGIGDIMAENYVRFFSDKEKQKIVEDILKDVRFEEAPVAGAEGDSSIQGKTFVITGALEQHENRNSLRDFIEDRGGRVAGSVSAKTDYLINNDNLSGSSKNKKAKELGIPVITEAQFAELLQGRTEEENA